MDFTILKVIVIIFALSTFVNFIFTKIKAPTILGYLLTGIVAGPHLLGLINALHEIELMAEIGVVLLMFSIGLEFSLNHLLKIRRIVFLGGFMQLIVTAALIMLIARMYDLDWKGALFIGFLTALSSTAVVLKLLQDRSEVTSNYGRTVLGILIFQDIVLVPLLLFTPLLGEGETTDIGEGILTLGMKAIFIIVFVYVGNKWLMPKILHAIALTRNKELFLMSILLICLSVALLTSELGMSLAVGAFLAGLMISESEYSYDAFGHLIPVKDIFTSFFFVSIGMLLDLNFVLDNYPAVLGTALLVVVVKLIVAGGTAFVLGHTILGTVMVGMSLSQVGEFSFILAKIGMDHEIISSYFYQLFLAVAIITMSISPFLINAAKPLGNLALRLPIPDKLAGGLFPLKQIEVPKLENHLVLIGKDSRALNLSVMSRFMNLPYISIVFDPASVRKMQEKGETAIYGDALNEPILHKAHVDTAEIVIVSIGDLITSMGVVEKVRRLNKHAFILVRTKHVQDIEELYKLGADQVIPEEFETAIELFERTLKKFLLPRRDIEGALARLRDDHYGIFREEDDATKYSILKDIPNIEVIAIRVKPGTFLVGKTLAGAQLRNTYGVTLVALKRNDDIIHNPPPDIVFKENDIAYILGKPEQIAIAVESFSEAAGT